MGQCKTTITITSGYRFQYFQWFLLGFWELENKDEITLKFELPFLQKMMFTKFINSNIYFAGLNRKLCNKLYPDDYNLRGYITFSDGRKKTFCIDSADSPFLFNENDLKHCNLYFKMQCPKELDKAGFRLTDVVRIPWLNHEHVDQSITLTMRGKRCVITDFQQYKEKIRPLMTGPRKLSRKLDYKSLKEGYNHYLKSQTVKKEGKLMCYFGNSMGPKTEKTEGEIDYDWEADIMQQYERVLNHPNEKRAQAADMIADIHDYATDARVISRTFSDNGVQENKELIIPLEEFCDHVAKFQYNLNISGYRLSIPNRFVESFMVGTSILTDQLSVKWYLPFDENEVIETVEMGYLRDEDVDWTNFKKDLKELKDSNPHKVIESYEQKWQPSVVAAYMINELEKL